MTTNVCFELIVKESEKNLVIIRSGLSEGDIEQFYEGTLIVEKDEIARDFVVKGRQPPDLLLFRGIHIVSARIKSLIEKLNIDGVQFLATQIQHKSGITIPGYSILNTLYMIPAWDIAHSVWMDDKREKTEYPTLNTLEIALKANLVENHDIFRLVIPRYRLFISEFLKNEIIDHGYNVGCDFVPAKCY